MGLGAVIGEPGAMDFVTEPADLEVQFIFEVSHTFMGLNKFEVLAKF